jgi:hypothetical protein
MCVGLFVRKTACFTYTPTPLLNNTDNRRDSQPALGTSRALLEFLELEIVLPITVYDQAGVFDKAAASQRPSRTI